MYKLTGAGVMNYRREKKLTKGDIKYAFFCGVVLVLFAVVVARCFILASN